jgi:hypothetical protein
VGLTKSEPNSVTSVPSATQNRQLQSVWGGIRCERLSLLITANQPFSECGNVPRPSHAPRRHRPPGASGHDPEMNVESYRLRAAVNRQARSRQVAIPRNSLGHHPAVHHIWKPAMRTHSSGGAWRDYAAPLQLKRKLLSLTSERLGCSEVE